MTTERIRQLALTGRIAPDPQHTRRCTCPACTSILAQIAKRRRRDAERRKERGR